MPASGNQRLGHGTRAEPMTKVIGIGDYSHRQTNNPRRNDSWQELQNRYPPFRPERFAQ